MLNDYERHYAFPGVMGTINFMVDGDFPNGHECQYNPVGLLIPVQTPRPIRLYAIQAEIKVIATGAQFNGLKINIVGRMNNHGGGFVMRSGITSPIQPLICWTGDMPNDWGWGVNVPSDAGLGATHKLVLTALYDSEDKHHVR